MSGVANVGIEGAGQQSNVGWAIAVSKDRSVVIEFLRFTVIAELREQFVWLDSDIWTPVLAAAPGFLSKEVWINPDDLTEVAVIVHWATFEEWQSIPQDELQRTEAAFSAAMGGGYELIESKRYQAR